MSEKLFVIACISNPQQYESRYRLYREFKKYMNQFDNVAFHTIEFAFKDRPFEITDESDPFAFQVRGDQEFWNKENLINIAIKRLPAHAKKIAWVDADIIFTNPNWVQDTLDALDHYKFVQMFSEYIDVGPKNEHLGKSTSFVYAYKNGTEQIINAEYNCGLKGATGLAWAANRDALDAVGGLLDWSVIGSGDWLMSYCLIGKASAISSDWLSSGYKLLLSKYEKACNEYVAGNIGYVNGLAVHYFHGPKTKRGYGWREGILKRHNFDPLLDLTTNSQGLYIVNKSKPGMLNELTDYFRSRDEDSTSLV